MERIGVLDSGLGGLSVVREILEVMPNADIVYYYDNLNAPYGNKTDDEIYSIVLNAVKILARKVDIIVLACNTATSVAIARLRREFVLPIVGTEPAIALAEGRCAVFATKATSRQNNFIQMINKRTDVDFLMPKCDCLATLIEDNISDLYPAQMYIKGILDNLHGLDSVVLGCTHYVFLREWLEKNFPKIKFVDGNVGVARQLKRICELMGISFYKKASLELFCSDENKIDDVKEKIKITCY